MVALSELTTQVTNATLTITGTKDLTGEGKKQVLFSLTTTDADSTTMSTFADLNYTSLVITAYKNGTTGDSATNPLEESPIYTRTLQGTQLNKAAINLDITHEETVGSESEFVPGTSYVFDVRFMTATAVTLIRKIHTFQNAPVAGDFTFTVSTGSNSLGLKVNTPSDKPKINELFVEIMELDDDNEPKRTAGIIDRYSLQKYTTAFDSTGASEDFANNGTDQIIRATTDSSLPNATGNLTQAETYNMNVIIVTDGGTSDKIRMTSGDNPNLLLSNKPNQPKVTIIDMQKQTDTDGASENQALGHYLPSVLVVYEIEGLSAGEILDKVKLDLRIAGITSNFNSHDTYAANDAGGSHFESDFVTATTINNVTRKFIALRLTRVADSNDVSNITLTGTALGVANSDLTVTYPTLATTHADSGNRTVAQVFEESFKVYGNNGGLGASIAAGGTTISDLKVIQIQVTALDFGVTIDNLNAQISNTSLDGSNGLSNAKNNFILQTDTTNTLAETASQTSFTTIDMDLPATAPATQLASNTFQVTQDELEQAGDQSFTIQSTIDLLERFVDNNLVQFVVLNIDNNGKKLFTLDSTTTPSAIDFLTGTSLTLTHGVAFGAAAQENSQTTYGAIPAGAGGAGPGNGNDTNTYLAFSTPVSIVFNGTEKISNIYIAVYMAAYDWGRNYYVGPQKVRSEIGSLVTSGSITAVADFTGGLNQYSGTSSGFSNSASIATKAKNALGTGSTSNQPLQAIFAGTRETSNSFVSMHRTPLIPLVEITQAEKALLPAGLPEIVIKVTENIVLDGGYVLTTSAGNTHSLAPYDLTNANMRPNQMKITLTNTSTNASQAFTFTGTTFTDLQQTPASGVTAGVYQVTLRDDTVVDGQTVSLVPGDTFDIYVALGNAVYGITEATTPGAAFTRLQTGNPDNHEGIQNTSKPFSTLTVKTTSHASSGEGATEVTLPQQENFTLFDREVQAPTVTITDQTTDVALGSEQIIVDVTANAADVDDTIDYTQLVLEVTTNDGSNDTTSTFTYGEEGVELDEEGGLTVNSKGNYTVQIINGDAITGDSDGGSITLTGGETVTVKATLKTDYSDGDQSAAVSKTIQASATLKTSGNAANYLLTDSGDASSALDALFDVDLITKTTLQFSPYHVNSGETTPTTWGNLINSNGISTTDLALTVTPQYETSADTYEDGAAINITILNGDDFGAISQATATTLNLEDDKVAAMRTRATNGETTQMKLKFTLTSTFEDGTDNTSTLTTTPFQPYLHKLTADSIAKGTVDYSSGTQDSLSWTVHYTPRAWKSDLSKITANYRLMKNNISGQYLDLSSESATTLLQRADEEKDTGLGATSTTFTKEFTTFARGSGLYPVFTLASTASKSSYAGSDNEHSTETTTGTGENAKLFTRSIGVKNSIIKATDGTQFTSYIPNGNTIATSFSIDNSGNSAITASYVKGSTTGVDKKINNNSQNAIFGTTQTITLKRAGTEGNYSNDIALVFDDLHTLNLTLESTTVSAIVDAINELDCFPSVINLPGTANDTPTAVWVLGSNLLIKDHNESTLATTATTGIDSTIELIYEGTKSTTSGVSFVPVTNAANNNCGIAINTTDNFIPLSSDSNDSNYSFTNDTNRIPLPTLVKKQKDTDGEGDINAVISVETSASGTANSVVATPNVSFS